jgi:hypothetical protein
MLPHFTRIARRVYAYIETRGEEGATTYEVEVGLGLSHQTTSARVWELRGLNRKSDKPAVIFDTGRRRKTGSGRKAVVYTSNPQQE